MNRIYRHCKRCSQITWHRITYQQQECMKCRLKTFRADLRPRTWAGV